MQFFGPEMTRTNLPGSWSSTDNALEDLAFQAKDVLFVIDDFIPTAADSQKLHAKADRVLRAAGNGTGRQRMKRDGSLRAERPPRGLIVSTGEDVPQGLSLQARLFIVEIAPDDISTDRLTLCQADAAAGLYATCMSGLLTWLAPQLEPWQQSMSLWRETIRKRLSHETMHRRAPGAVADLLYGIKLFADFAQACGALSEVEAKAFVSRADQGILQTATAQQSHQGAGDPAERFLELLRNAIGAGRAHVAGLKGDQPCGNPRHWGWILKMTHDSEDWQPRGECVGFAGDGDLYLLPDVAYSVVRRLSVESGDAQMMTLRTIKKRLSEAKLLTSTDAARQTLTVRRTLKGAKHDVLHLAAMVIVSEDSDSLSASESSTPDEDEDPFAEEASEWGNITS
jgi:hypothetical protein